jgi:hypothetical protein
VSALAVQDLRRVAAAVARLRGETVREVTVRSDLRQIRVELESGLTTGGRGWKWMLWSCRNPRPRGPSSKSGSTKADL